MVVDAFGDDLLSGRLFLFRLRRGDRLKVLWWDRDAFVLWHKRLGKGVFRTATLAPPPGAFRIELSRRELAMLLEGIDVKHTRESRRFRLPSR